MTEGNWDDFDEEAIDEMVRRFERMGMPVDVDVLRSLIKQVRDQFEQPVSYTHLTLPTIFRV